MHETAQLPDGLVPAEEAAPERAPRPSFWSRLVRRRWPWVAGFVLSSTGAGGFGAYLHTVRRAETAAGVKVVGRDVGGVAFADLPSRLQAIADEYLDRPVTLVVGKQRAHVARRELGLRVDTSSLAAEIEAIGRSGDPFVDLPQRRDARRGAIDLPAPLSLDRGRALEYLEDVKEALDRAPVDAHLDLDHHAIAPEQPGTLVEVYQSLARLDEAARVGADQIELAVVEVPAQVARKDLADIDISTVVGTWETHYSTNTIDSDRTFNLKVGADHLNGHILKPHELFSFNEVVGDRTEKEGYRVAPVISGGELIDGLAGGMCQIASTLHAASFFAGLEIVSSTPHSRPSAYIPLGLDSTVVYPSTDLKIRNPFDFPIVMRYQVNQGTVKVELLGKSKPYKVIFEREITEEHAFGTSSRHDPRAPKGQKLVLQEGYPGYAATRRRYIFDAATNLPRSLGGPEDPITKALEKAHVTPLKVEKWQVRYPSTEEIVAWGSGSPKLPKKDRPPSHHIPAIPKTDKPIVRILR